MSVGLNCPSGPHDSTRNRGILEGLYFSQMTWMEFGVGLKVSVVSFILTFFEVGFLSLKFLISL